ncbi:MAG: calcium-translocating P-type ATPase, PMCA-type [Clostridiaceae bacterium]
MIQEKELYRGLSSEEATKRLKVYGSNIIIEKKKISPIFILLAQFNDFIIWVLLAATLVSGLMREMSDAITILIIVIINAILGFIQEYRTEKSLEALKSMAAPTCKVMRDGKVKVVNAEEITIGDIILLEAGDRIPADGVLIECSGVLVDESLLTGESMGVSKSASGKNNYVYMGTTILKGRGKAKIAQIGMKTEMGKIADMLQSIEEEKSPIKIKLNHLGKLMVVICLVICAAVTVLGILRGQPVGEMFLLGVSLAVAAIPEGLPAIVTVSLALGVSRMLKRNALVRKLPAVETLGCTSVICSDKTGTLTENKMSVMAVFVDGKVVDITKERIPEVPVMKKACLYCSDCIITFDGKDMNKLVQGDPTETALIKAFYTNGTEMKAYLDKVIRTFDLPFDSNRKLMSVVIREGGKEVCYVKGAPEKLLERCTFIIENGQVAQLTNSKKMELLRSIESMSSKALRCISIAYKEKGISYNSFLESELVYVGTLGIMDPPRKEVKEAVLKCRIAGIRPIMITGDHKNTAYAVAKELDICSKAEEVMTGEELEKIDDNKLKNVVTQIKVFARVTPNHKLRIVRALKGNNNIVAMTGDGVNDAPAVKEADIGVSMGISGTDVTKEASSMILLDDNFNSIVSAVEEGRVIYDNIRKFIRYLLSCNLGEVLTMFLASLFYLENPLSPIQILFVNLATDGLPAMALSVDPPDIDVMGQKPREKSEGIFARGLSEKIAIRGVLIGTCTLLSFIYGKYYGYSLDTCRTMALGTLVLSQLFHVFECRSERHSIFEIKLFTNPYLIGAVAVSVLMLLGVIYIDFFNNIFETTALGLGQWLTVIFFSGIIGLMNSLYLYFKTKK